MKKYLRILRRVRSSLNQALKVPDNVRERNIWHLYQDMAWYGVLNSIATTFTSVFAIRLGASNTLVGLLSSLPGLISIFWLIPSARLIETQIHLIPTILWSGFLHRLAYFLVALMPSFLHEHRAEALVCLIVLSTIPAGAANTAFTSMMAEVVSLPDRARVVSVRHILFSATGMLTVLIAGKLLDLISFPLNYQIIFGLGFAASLVSLYHISRIQAPAKSVAPRSAPARQFSRERMQNTVHNILAYRDFTRFTVSTFLFNWGLYLPIALYPIYRVRVLGISDTWIGLISMVESGTTVVFYYLWGKIASRYGNRIAIIAGSVGLVFFPVLTALSTRPEPLVLVAVVAGAFGPALTLGTYNALLEVCPEERRASYIAIYNTLVNVNAFFGPLLGTTLATFIGIRQALWLAGVMRFLGALTYVRLPFREKVVMAHQPSAPTRNAPKE
ncbi:MAG: MFS transporter [Chloroflexi bacterium]|nr:MFS transporter [Chloroflexota bacterium]